MFHKDYEMWRRRIRVGVLGSHVNGPSSDGTFNLGYSVVIDSMYTGIDWLYTHVEGLYMFNYKLTYLLFLDSVYDDSIDFFFTSVWFLSLQLSGLQLFWSIILDSYIFSNLIQFNLTDEWVRGFVSSKDTALLFVYHPEIVFFKNFMFNQYYFEYLADINVSAIQYLESQSLLTPIMLFPQLLFLAYVGFLFAAFYFSFYSSPSKEESTIDADYLAAGVTVESEKEIGSIDDIIMPAIIFVYTFGWYFYLHCWNNINSCPEVVFVFFFFPLLYYTILNTPTFLLYDFGILYNCYLRGIAPSPTIVFELMYDYIAVIAFYARILTQGVRLALMFFIYAAMHDFVLYTDFNHRWLTGNESIWEDIANVNASVSSVTYFILGVLPTHIMNWMYEVFHTFFVVTGQLVAYFAMIFWLFLFLFTFFIIEKQESYFEERKKYRQDLLKKIRSMDKDKG